MIEKIIILSTLLLSGGTRNPIYDEEVAEMKIFAYCGPLNISNIGDEPDSWGGGIGLLTGHCFIQIKNISYSSLTVGHLVLYHNDTITIGCWPWMIDFQDAGLWYNRESFDVIGWSALENYTMVTNITQLGVDGITLYLTNSSNDGYSVTDHTCANVAVELWNIAAPNIYLQLSPNNPSLPGDVKGAISTHNHYINESYTINNYCGYVDGTSGYVTYISNS